ncbi:hypothetical protein [Winogradskya humida]|uniref:hypothetical protein n=1 Tax=Winogradskya humida TaxID=113566 RepID=UPI0019445D34|nr:hypothetical protein [Actinoplanes humidus]
MLDLFGELGVTGATRLVITHDVRLVTTLGGSATAGNQIAVRFDAATATAITVHVPTSKDAPPAVSWSAPDNVARLNGVTAIAAWSRTREGRDLPDRAVAVRDLIRILDRLPSVL